MKIKNPFYIENRSPNRNSKKSGLSYSKKLSLTGFRFILPALIYFCVIGFYPVGLAIYTSFTKYNLFTPRVFIGFENYRQIFSSSDFFYSLRITGFYVIVSSALLIVFSFGLALLLNGKFPLRNVYRFCFFLPMVISLVVVSIIFKSLFRFEGLVNAITFLNIDWLNSKSLAIWVIILLSLWKWSGFYMIVFLTGLENIPREYIEASKIDGAGYFGVFRHIILPSLKPTFAFTSVIALIGGVKVFDPIWIVTKGGPIDSTKVLAWRIYETAFAQFQMGKASAMSMVLFVILLIFTILQIRILERGEQ